MPSRSQARVPRDALVPALLRPLVRAYILGYASAVAPRLLTLLLQHMSRATRARRARTNSNTSRDRQKAAIAHPADDPRRRSFARAALHILATGLECQRFATFCAALAGGTTLLQVTYPGSSCDKRQAEIGRGRYAAS